MWGTKNRSHFYAFPLRWAGYVIWMPNDRFLKKKEKERKFCDVHSNVGQPPCKIQRYV